MKAYLKHHFAEVSTARRYSMVPGWKKSQPVIRAQKHAARAEAKREIREQFIERPAPTYTAFGPLVEAPSGIGGHKRTLRSKCSVPHYNEEFDRTNTHRYYEDGPYWGYESEFDYDYDFDYDSGPESYSEFDSDDDVGFDTFPIV